MKMADIPLTARDEKSTLGGTVGGRSSMVEPQIVVLVVAGSSPVGHPNLQFLNKLNGF